MEEEISDDLEEEVESRVRDYLLEIGEDPDSDSDHAMYFRQDTRNQVRAERRLRDTRLTEQKTNRRIL